MDGWQHETFRLHVVNIYNCSTCSSDMSGTCRMAVDTVIEEEFQISYFISTFAPLHFCLFLLQHFGASLVAVLSSVRLCLSMAEDTNENPDNLPPTQAYPEPPVTPPELLRAPPGLEPPLKPGSILQKFVEEVDLTKLLESGSTHMAESSTQTQHRVPDDNEYGDLTDCENERDEVGLQIFRCQWQNSHN